MWNGTSKFSNVVLGLACTAPMGVGLFSLLLGLSIPAVTEWFWPAPATNVAEAAALGDAARIRELAARGARLDVPMPIQPMFLEGDAPPAMSALEAAIRRRSESLVGVLLELGVRPPADEMRRLYCLAVRVEATKAAELLEDAFRLPSGSCNAPPAQGGGG